MLWQKTDIVNQLQKDILLLQGFKRFPSDAALEPTLGPLDDFFPNKSFPLASIHEFLTAGNEYTAATAGFITCLLSSLMKKGAVSAWISPSQTIFPPALKSFGIDPDKMIFIKIPNQKSGLWVMEEALKCEGLASVVGEIPDINFTASRRLQLAVEKSRVTGFIIRDHSRNLNSNACTARWKISPLPSSSENNLPGVGFPRWNIELLKIKNGKPGRWHIEWSLGEFRYISPEVISEEEKRKVG